MVQHPGEEIYNAPQKFGLVFGGHYTLQANQNLSLNSISLFSIVFSKRYRLPFPKKNSLNLKLKI